MPRPKEHTVSLTITDRVKLKKIVSTGSHPVRMVTRAKVLLALDETDGPVSDRRVIAEQLGISEGTVFRVAKQFGDTGGRVDQVVARKKRVVGPREVKVTGDVEARIIALACTQPPEGYSRWSLRLLEKHVLLTDGIPPLAHSTIGDVLKRGRLSLI